MVYCLSRGFAYPIGMAASKQTIYEKANDTAETIVGLSSRLAMNICVPFYTLPVIFYSLYAYYVSGAEESSFEVIFYMA